MYAHTQTKVICCLSEHRIQQSTLFVFPKSDNSAQALTPLENVFPAEVSHLTFLQEPGQEQRYGSRIWICRVTRTSISMVSASECLAQGGPPCKELGAKLAQVIE